MYIWKAAVDLLSGICKMPGNDCSDLMTSFTGKNCCLNSSMIDKFLEHEPHSTSTKNMIHLARMIRTGTITMYDYGNAYDNYKHYGQSTPPTYDMSSIPNDFPMYLSYGGADELSDVEDVKTLLDSIKDHDPDRLIVQYKEDYGHADFIFAVNAKEVVYDPRPSRANVDAKRSDGCGLHRDLGAVGLQNWPAYSTKEMGLWSKSPIQETNMTASAPQVLLATSNIPREGDNRNTTIVTIANTTQAPRFVVTLVVVSVVGEIVADLYMTPIVAQAPTHTIASTVNSNPTLTHPMVTRFRVGTNHPTKRCACHVSPISLLLKSYTHAFNDPHWYRAMLDEYNALIKNKTWILVPRPQNVNIFRCLWLFRHKHNADGSLNRYKACLVTNGSSQLVGIDVDETFSPVVKPATIHTVLSLAISRHWLVHQFDVKNAFLNGYLSETVYMQQPPSFRDSQHPDYVCLLQRSLYRLKQAPWAWFQRFATYAARVGFHHREPTVIGDLIKSPSKFKFVTLASTNKPTCTFGMNGRVAMEATGPPVTTVGPSPLTKPFSPLFLSMSSKRYSLGYDPPYRCLGRQIYGYGKSDLHEHGADIAYLLLYVDDIVLTASSTTFLQRIITSLHAEFSMTDFGPLNYFLGVFVTRDTFGMFLSQQKYATKVLEHASMLTCNQCRTPIDTDSKLSADGDPVSDPTLYRSLAGALQYLTFTRPDISYAVQEVCLFMHDPREPYFLALKRILRYVRGTLSYGLQLYSSTTSTLVAYSDADWAVCPTTRQSTSGYCVFLGNNLLSWTSKRQFTISRSSAEAEYQGVANAVAETCWLRNFFHELRTQLSTATLVYCDNCWVIKLAFVAYSSSRKATRVKNTREKTHVKASQSLSSQVGSDGEGFLSVEQPEHAKGGAAINI
nr:ribonuclease H-like domain-containing protein [Tanacetum cinerariifolium]